MKAIFFAVILAFSTTFSTARADEGGPSTWKRDTAIVMFSAVGGAILGLSTLSFYGSPQDHTQNITTGALLGLIGGVAYVFWEGNQQAEAPHWSFDLNPKTHEPIVGYTYNF